VIHKIRRVIGEEAYGLLLGSGLDWKLEQGGSHKKLMISGRLVGVIPNNLKPARGRREAELNFKAQVKRIIREMGGYCQK
jgi:hypothetical protein